MEALWNWKKGLLFIVILQIYGCPGFQGQPTTDLFGKARPTGTATLLRVDHSLEEQADALAAKTTGEDSDESTGLEQTGPRYVPLRHKSDVRGLAGPENIVTDQDFVTVGKCPVKELGHSSCLRRIIRFGIDQYECCSCDGPSVSA